MTGRIEDLQLKVDAVSRQRFVIKQVDSEEVREGQRIRTKHTVTIRDRYEDYTIKVAWDSFYRALKSNPDRTWPKNAVDIIARHNAYIKESSTDHLRYSIKESLGEEGDNPRFRFYDALHKYYFECDWKSFVKSSKNKSHRFIPDEDSLRDKWQKEYDLISKDRVSVKSVRRSKNRFYVTVTDNVSDVTVSEESYRLRSMLVNETWNPRKPVSILGKKVDDVAESTGYSKSHLYFLKRNYSREQIHAIVSSPKKGSSLEEMVLPFFKGFNVVRDKQLSGTSFKPDFYIPERNLVVECDGLYWHSELNCSSEYHRDKKVVYDEVGVKSLFFRGDEIRNSPHVVKSIIDNKLGKSIRVYARNTTVDEAPVEFFQNNHLMGRGMGRRYGLYHNGKVVAGIRVRWITRNKKFMDISRFCTAPGYSVVGGFSKLIKHVINKESPNSIRTYVDRRYGDGKYLKSLGWKRLSENTSFAWTDLRSTFHRMRYPKESGYEEGLVKIWDCGQARWERVV